ncbi:MAG: hypothetical protein IJ318_03080 [Clostridia bacterium]|nr:hypothetical protein [Clostridia bacterium]
MAKPTIVGVWFKAISPGYWWLRSPNADNGNNAWYVNNNGNVNNNNVNNSYGARPDIP